jgi:hypothetical protein
MTTERKFIAATGLMFVAIILWYPPRTVNAQWRNDIFYPARVEYRSIMEDGLGISWPSFCLSLVVVMVVTTAMLLISEHLKQAVLGIFVVPGPIENKSQ